MAPLDLNRAFVMANEVTDPESREQAVAQLFRYMLASEDERMSEAWL
jgi:hypothetical protein